MRLVTINACLQSAIFGIVRFDDMLEQKAENLANILLEGQFINTNSRSRHDAPRLMIDFADDSSRSDIYDKDTQSSRSEYIEHDAYISYGVYDDNFNPFDEPVQSQPIDAEPDIIALQGVFDKRAEKIIIKKLQSKYPYALTDQRLPPFIVGVRSGLLILSKYAIEKASIYEYKVFSGLDTFAAKSVMCAKISYGIRDFYVFNTHLQGDVRRGFGRDLLDLAAILRKRGVTKHYSYKFNHFETIEKQLHELKTVAENFITNTQTYDTDPAVMIVGDFCTNDTEYITNTVGSIFSAEIFDDNSSCGTSDQMNPFINSVHKLRLNCAVCSDEKNNESKSEVFRGHSEPANYILTNLKTSTFTNRFEKEKIITKFTVCDFDAPKLY